MTPTELSAIRTRWEASSPGEWKADSIDNEDGIGRFKSFAILGPDGKLICDTANSLAAEVHTEHDEDGSYSWDEIGRRNIEFAAHSHQDIPALLSHIASLESRLKVGEWHVRGLIEEILASGDEHGPETDGVADNCPTCIAMAAAQAWLDTPVAGKRETE